MTSALSRLHLGFCAAALLSLGACGSGEPGSGAQTTAATAAAPGKTVEITVIGTSDLHGRLSALPLLGGYLSALRAKNPEGVVLVDAGDMFQGTLESNTEEGAPVVEAYKKLGYDAVAIGNHEFDYGPVGEASTVRKDAKDGPDKDSRGALKARALQAKGSFPFLAANILEDEKPLSWPNVIPSLVVTKHGVSVGIIGVTTFSTTKTTIAANVVGIRITPPAQAITEQAKALRERGAKVVVVAAHAGGECTKLDVPTDLSSCDGASEIFEVARALPSGAVQAIVAGHTHKAIAHEVAGIPILQSNAWGTAFGRVDLTVDAATGAVTRFHIHPPEQESKGASFEGTQVVPDAQVEGAVSPAIERAKARRAESLSVMLSDVFAAKYREESALGNLVTSLFLELDPKADVALGNGGGLRADLAPGPLTYGMFYDALPFDNRVARLTMTGRKLKDLFQRNLTGQSGILSIAGARVEGHCDSGKLAIDIVLTPAKKPEHKLADDDKVRVITNEFLATNGDDFSGSSDVEIDESGPPFRDPLAALLKKQKGTLKPEEWLVPKKPRIHLPNPPGANVCVLPKP